MTVITRFPPSPTGYLHIGGARTALYSWLYARQQGGKFILRIEDTDQERSTPESVQAILDAMQWLELDYDEGPYYQTQRFDRYAEVVTQLIEQGDAYYCECSKARLDSMREEQRAAGLKPKYDGRCRDKGLSVTSDTVVRFKNPQEGNVLIQDWIKGSLAVSNTELDDLVIARSDGSPTYNLTVVVDDWDMQITHVIRGDDHVNNTPRQINILKALGADIPVYAHVPMILGSDGARMSKRHGAVSVMQYKEDGLLPEALLGYLARLGWSHGDQELFTIDELLALFKLENVSRSPASFDPDKLLWVNQETIKALPIDELIKHAGPYYDKRSIDLSTFSNAGDVIELMRDRCKTLVELVVQTHCFFADIQAYDALAIEKWVTPETPIHLDDLLEQLNALALWEAKPIQAAVKQVIKGHSLKFPQLAQPVRIAVTGSTDSPSIDQTLACLGREKSCARLEKAVAKFTKL